MDPNATLPAYNESARVNLSLLEAEAGAELGAETAEDYVFDRADVRALFILLYSLVFCCCFFGNLLVIVVVTLSRRLRSITNFFLANLAVADLCVGMFCVYQNLSIYLAQSWVLGDLVCKLYHFMHSLSYTASIFILVVICTERYFAIIHPITCKQILTPRRLRVVIACVWILSALYSSPRFLWVQTVSMHIGRGTETICISHRQKYNSEAFDIINLGLLYALPLCVMLLLYTRISIVLWDSSSGNLHHRPRRERERERDKECAGLRVRFSAGEAVSISSRTSHHHHAHVAASQHVLRARRGVVRMLIVVVLTFALCNLPFHARKMWQYWSPNYSGGSAFSTLFTPATFLLTYFNSAINPILYAFLSRNFRKGMRELLGGCCRCARDGNGGDGGVTTVGAGPSRQTSVTRRTSVRSATRLCPG